MTWISSFMCFLAGFDILCFTSLVQLLLLFLSLARLMITAYPLDTKFKRASVTLKANTGLCFVSLLVSAIVSSAFLAVPRMMPMETCLPFVSPEKSVITTSVMIFTVCTQFLVSFAVLLCHILCVYFVKKSHQKVTAGKQINTQSDTSLILQLV